MSDDLVRLASSVLNVPTLEEVDLMLTMLKREGADVATQQIRDGLLDYRASLTA